MRRLWAWPGFLFFPSTAWACAVCFGDGKSNMARAIWPGVYLLLGLIGLVFVPILWMGWTWMRRESRGASGLAQDHPKP